MRTLAATLMSSTNMYDRVLFSPTEFVLGGEDDGSSTQDDEPFDELPDSDADEGEPEGQDKRESKDKRKITDDPEEFMRDLFGAGDDDGEDEDDEESEEEIQKAQETMAKNLRDGLNSLTLPQDIIPEDFDPSDPAKLKSLLEKVQINAATQTVRLVFGPVQETLNRMGTQFRREMRQTSRDGHQRVAERTALQEAFPGIANPILAPSINFAYEAAKKKHPNDRNAAFAATRKALRALGIQGWDEPYKRGRSGSGESDTGSSFLEGTAALDGLGLHMPTMKPGNRMRRGNR